MRSDKAQMAYEFLLIFFFLTALFTTITLVAAKAKERVDWEQAALRMDDLGLGLQHDFYTAARMPDGFTRNITLPPLINNKKYEATINENNGLFSLSLATEGMSYDYTLPTLQRHEQLRPPPATNTLTKKNGVLTLN